MAYEEKMIESDIRKRHKKQDRRHAFIEVGLQVSEYAKDDIHSCSATKVSSMTLIEPFAVIKNVFEKVLSI